ncbi:MAG: hypothetical protein JXP34_26775 [Planctomycetes bacterium]|nr:hypothetical protein [Planctomycetota bacterium]
MIVRCKGWLLREPDNSVRFYGARPRLEDGLYVSDSPTEMTVCENDLTWPWDAAVLDLLRPGRPQRATVAITIEGKGLGRRTT